MLYYTFIANLQAKGFLTTDYSTFMFNSVAYSVDCSSGIDTCPGTQVSNCDSYGGLLAVKCEIRKLTNPSKIV